ncbi:hypothetical protein M407DRAFT_247236 [Tulasnella calospora MUT 4182]|uniref:Uncharacterized protein n=1 Tax=Tulasnella calospora MUT 4182 TaxID=1051891 RepID=A0A0C3L112_9AGAM|nr:hypothetical protein M407DRAFT_247236 [Tulasnella calospora MUT 4182]
MPRSLISDGEYVKSAAVPQVHVHGRNRRTIGLESGERMARIVPSLLFFNVLSASSGHVSCKTCACYTTNPYTSPNPNRVRIL